MFHFHKWSDWVVIESGKLIDQWMSHHILGSYVIQQRFCHKCGKTQVSTDKTTLRSDVRLVPEVTKKVPKHDKV